MFFWQEPLVVITDYEPIPEESTFVAEHRESIPVRAGLNTATSAGYAILRGKQKTRGKVRRDVPKRSAQADIIGAATRGRRGRGRGSTSGGRGRGVTETSAIPKRGQGRGEWLLFGDDQASTSQQAQLDEQIVLESTQEPPTM
jgi:hypothetical protein